MERLVFKIISGIHTTLYRLTGGRLFTSVQGAQVLLLTTTGRKTARPRTKPVMYVQDGDAYVIIASNAGRPANPAWYRNLQSNPDATIQVKNCRLHVQAETASDEERERLWPTMTAIYSGYDAYQAKVERQIPLVILREADASTAR